MLAPRRRYSGVDRDRLLYSDGGERLDLARAARRTRPARVGSKVTAPLQPAIVVLAHTAPRQVRRLVDIFDQHQIVLHCDAKAPPALFAEMTQGLPDRVLVAPRRDSRLACWSLVAAELECLRIALAQTQAEHIAVISGSDYPLVEPGRLGELLAARTGQSWIRTDPMPYRPWDSRFFHDGGLWRMKFHFPTRHGQLILVAGKPVFVPIRRRIHRDLEPTASEQWKIFCRADALAVLALVDSRRDLLRFGRSCYTPDESFIASLLASPRLFPDRPLPQGEPGAWLVNWPREGRQHHPDWFTAEDIPALRGRLAAMPPKLFARKFDPNDGNRVVGLVERQLW